MALPRVSDKSQVEDGRCIVSEDPRMTAWRRADLQTRNVYLGLLWRNKLLLLEPLFVLHLFIIVILTNVRANENYVIYKGQKDHFLPFPILLAFFFFRDILNLRFCCNLQNKDESLQGLRPVSPSLSLFFLKHIDISQVMCPLTFEISSGASHKMSRDCHKIQAICLSKR